MFRDLGLRARRVWGFMVQVLGMVAFSEIQCSELVGLRVFKRFPVEDLGFRV